MTKIVYGRVSFSRDEEVATSLPTQKRIIQEYAKRKGHTVLEKDWYMETKSGFNKKANRKMFKKMLKRLEDDDVSGVIFHKVDRSSRNMDDFVKLEKFFDTKEIIVIEGEFDTSKAQGRMQFRIFCTLAMWYSENLSEEVTTKMEQRLLDGYYPTLAPIGYKTVKTKWKNGKLVGDGTKVPDKYFPLVQQCFKLYTSGQYSFRSLAKEMNKRGLRNKAGNKLVKASIEKMFNNPFYYGYMKFGNYPRLYKGNHKPCVSKALWDKVQAVREGKSVKGDTVHNYAYNMAIRYEGQNFLVGEKQKGHIYYRVGNFPKDLVKFHVQERTCKSLREEFLDETFRQYFRRLGLKKEFFENYKRMLEKAEKMLAPTMANEGEVELNVLNQELIKIESRSKSLGMKLLDGVLSDNDFRDIKKELDSQKTEVEERKMEVDRNSNYEELKTEKAFFSSIKSFGQLLEKICTNFSSLNPGIKRELLELFFEVREVADGVVKTKPHKFLERMLDVSNFLPLEPQKAPLAKGLTCVDTKNCDNGGPL